MSWTIALNGGPKRVNHAAVAIGDKIYLFGGHSAGQDTNVPMDVFVLNTVTNRWKEVTVVNNKEFEVVYPPEDDGDQFEPKVPDCPHLRYAHTVCAYNGKAYIWGGSNGEYRLNQYLYEFDPVTSCFKYIPAIGEIPRSLDGHTAIVHDQKMYIFGGYQSQTKTLSNDTYVFDFLTHRWSLAHTCGEPPSWRDYHTAVVLDGKMYIFGGRSDQMGQQFSSNDVYFDNLKALDLTTFEWAEIDTNGEKPSGRRSHAAWAHNGKMFVFGGFFGTKVTHYDDLYSFNPKTNLWKKFNPRNLVKGPCARRRCCSVVIKNKVFIFGGTGTNSEELRGLTDFADLFVLDMMPSLHDLAAHAILKNFKSLYIEKLLPIDAWIKLDLMTLENPILWKPCYDDYV